MESFALVLAFGGIFIVLGRWLYRNPRTLYPGWGLLNREHSDVQKLGRAYATFVIFFGSLACASVIILRLIPGPFTVILSLAAAIGATWLLRPRLPEQAPAVTSLVPDTNAIPKKTPLLSPHWKRNLVIIGGLAAVFVVFVFALIGNSDVSKLAFATAQASPIVRQRLGEPIKRWFFSSGKIEISGPMGSANLAIPISGPKGKATLYVVGSKRGGPWKLDTLDVQFGEGTEAVSLLQGPAESGQKPTQ